MKLGIYVLFINIIYVCKSVFFVIISICMMQHFQKHCIYS